MNKPLSPDEVVAAAPLPKAAKARGLRKSCSPGWPAPSC
jgi:hypothetical protein